MPCIDAWLTDVRVGDATDGFDPRESIIIRCAGLPHKEGYHYRRTARHALGAVHEHAAAVAQRGIDEVERVVQDAQDVLSRRVCSAKHTQQ